MKFKLGNFKVNGSPLIFFCITFAILFLVWMLLSGKWEWKFVIFGIVASLAIAYICTPFLIVTGSNKKQFYLFGCNPLKLLIYSAWLIKEIALSSLATTRLVLSPHMEYLPRIVYFSIPFKNPAATMFLANSITLTPGTITLDVLEDGVFEVHALTAEAEASLMSGVMAKKTAWLYGENCEFTPLPGKKKVDIGTLVPKQDYWEEDGNA